MYTMLSLMIGTAYFDMENGQSNVQDRIGVLYYIHAFLTFMSIAVIPALIIERAVQERERRNKLYKTEAYVISHWFSGLPFLFMISLISSLLMDPS